MKSQSIGRIQADINMQQVIITSNGGNTLTSSSLEEIQKLLTLLVSKVAGNIPFGGETLEVDHTTYDIVFMWQDYTAIIDKSCADSIILLLSELLGIEKEVYV